MAIPSQLQNFKSSGVYILEFDKSQIPQVQSNILRLVIGFSKKGVINTPVYIPTAEYFKEIFGDIDRTLERNGSFFHRSALTCLEQGAILAMNLLVVDDTLDRTEFRPFSMSVSQQNHNKSIAPLSEYFNTDKFWFYNSKNLDQIAVNHANVPESLFTVANVGKKQISVLTKKTSIQKKTNLGLNVTAREWYSNSDVPAFMSDSDLISDFCIDIIVVEGNFENNLQLSSDLSFGKYFDNKGLKKTLYGSFGATIDGLDAFLNSGLVKVIGQYTGVVIPDFVTKNGENLFIEELVNFDVVKTGLLIHLNKTRLDSENLSGDGIDLVGHSIKFANTDTLDFLSYYGSLLETITYTEGNYKTKTFLAMPEGATNTPTTTNAVLGVSSSFASNSAYQTGRYDTISIYGVNHPNVINGLASSAFSSQASFDAFVASVQTDKSFVSNILAELNSAPNITVATKIHVAEVATASQNSNSTAIDYIQIRIGKEDDLVGGIRYFSHQYYYIAGSTTQTTVGVVASVDSLSRTSSGSLIATQGSKLYNDVISGLITDGDIIVDTDADRYISFTLESNSSLANVGVLNGDGFSKLVGYITIKAWDSNAFVNNISIPVSTNGSRVIKTITGNLNETFTVKSLINSNSFTLDNTLSGEFGLGGYNGKIRKNDYLTASFDNGTSNADPRTLKTRLTRILSVVEDKDPISITYGQITVKTADSIWVQNNKVERYKPIEDFVSHYRFTSLSGYLLRSQQMPNNTNDRMNQILDVMYSSNIAQALADKDSIDFRYVIDTFNHGIEGESKSRLSRISKNRQRSISILNAPSIEEFKKSTNPLFRLDSSTPFDPAYIATGGNLDAHPSNIYSLPSVDNGSNYAAFFSPNLLIRDTNGTTISVPPAAYVSNLFIQKYKTTVPYAIVAGTKRGQISANGLVGVEYGFSRSQLDLIEPFGFNTILNKKGFGFVINANQSAQQNIKSALSQIHVRELLIYIQQNVESILENYRWEFNTSQIRLEIKTLVDNFLSNVLTNGGIYNFDTIMDNRNNTNEIIDNNMGIIDIGVEPVRGLGIIVARYTVLRTGGVAAGEFVIPS